MQLYQFSYQLTDDFMAEQPPETPPDAQDEQKALNPTEALTETQQNRNAIYYGLIIAIGYIAAPVAYIDLIHASMLDTMGASKMVANMPTAMASVFDLVPLFVAWLIPHTRWLKLTISMGYLLAGLSVLMVAIALSIDITDETRIVVTIVHASILRACYMTANLFLWEVVIRSIPEDKRGKAFGIAFSVGPFLAVASASGAQFLLGGDLDKDDLLLRFALIFVVVAMVFFLMAQLTWRFYVPRVEQVETRESFVDFMFGGIGTFLTSRTLVAVAVANLLFMTGLMAMNTDLLQVQEVLGVSSTKVAGLSAALRYGGKGVAAIVLGLMLARFGARSPALGTSIFLVSAVVWAMVVRGHPYLMAFALYGAGELGGLYYPHYLVAASKVGRLKRNLAIYSIVGMLGYGAALLHGWLADHFGGMASSLLALGAAVVALWIIIKLPRRPKPVN